MKNEVLNLKERMTGYIRGYGGRNTQGDGVIIISKGKIKFKRYKTVTSL